MVNQHFFGIFLSLNVALLVVSGFQTPRCTHEELEAKLTEYFKCSARNANEEMEAMLAQNQLNDKALGCAFLDKEIACFTDHIGACFDEEVITDMATLLDYSYTDLPYVQCKRIAGHRGQRIEAKVVSIVAKYAQYLKNPQIMDSIISMDNQCSTDRFIQSLDNDMTCLKNTFQTVGTEFANNMKYLAQGYSASMPICTWLVDALNCFSSNRCLSQKEVDLVKNTIVTTYSFLMKLMTQMYQKVGGSFVELMKLLGEEEKFDTMTYEEKLQFRKIANILFQMVLDDYKTTSCQSKLGKFYDFIAGF